MVSVSELGCCGHENTLSRGANGVKELHITPGPFTIAGMAVFKDGVGWLPQMVVHTTGLDQQVIQGSSVYKTEPEAYAAAMKAAQVLFLELNDSKPGGTH